MKERTAFMISLPGNLLLVDGGLTLVLIPGDLGILVNKGIFIRDRDDARGVRNFLSTDTEWVTRNPKEGSLGVDGRVEVGIALSFLGIRSDLEWAGDQTTQCGVIGVDIRAQELGEKVGLAVGGRQRSVSKALLRLGRVNRTNATVDIADTIIRGRCSIVNAVRVVLLAELGTLLGQKRLLLVLHVLGQVVDERLHGAVHRDVVQDGENQENDHQGQRTNGNLVVTGGHGEQTDQANDE